MAEKKILIIDDEGDLVETVSFRLESHGYNVASAKSGEEGLKLANRFMPDLILLDVMMPGIDGFTTCERMRALDPHLDTPIVMLTAADDYTAIDKAFAARATDFIVKPFQWRLLLQRVRYALRSGRLNREVRLSRLRQATARRLARLTFFQWDLDADQITWTDASLPITGVIIMAPARLDVLAEIAHDDDRQRVDAAIRRTRVYGEPLDVEVRVLAEGQEYIVRVVGQAGTLGPDQRVISGALQDITDQRRTEQLAAAAQRTT